MTFATDMADDLGDIFTTDGEAVAATYTNVYAGSAAASCTVIKHQGMLAQPSGLEGQVWAEGIKIEARRSEVDLPHKDDTFTIGATTYTVLGVSEYDDYIVICAVR